MRTRTRILVVAILSILSLPAARAQFPATPAARQFSAWLNAFNSGDRTTLLQFLQKNFPTRVPQIEAELGFRLQTGGFDFRKVEESIPTRFSRLVQERGSDQFARFTVEVEPAPPHRITRLDLRAIPRPPGFAIARLSERDALGALRAKVEADAAAGRFAGAVLGGQERPARL